MTNKYNIKHIDIQIVIPIKYLNVIFSSDNLTFWAR